MVNRIASLRDFAKIEAIQKTRKMDILAPPA